MSVIAIGLDHHSAPVDVRGRYAFPADRLPSMLRAFRADVRENAEVTIVSTCNRTELYVGSGPQGEDNMAEQAMAWLAKVGGMKTPEPLARHAYVFRDAVAARHAFRLASGMASMVVGETQILGQLKQAVRQADGAGTLGTTLNQLFQRSFAVAKEVRSETEIGMHTISLAAAIARLADDLFEDFGALRVLLIGAGDMAAPVMAHLAARSPRELVIANRSLDRAQALAAHFNATAVGLAEGVARLADFDVVISCTASTLPVLGLGAVERAIKARRRKPMLMVDLAVPRDIEAEVAALTDVYLYTIDDLARLVQSGSDKRLAACGQAESIIESGVQDFVRWMETRQSVPLIQALQNQAERWRAAELQRARRLLARGDSMDSVLEALSRGLTQKMLHGPMTGLQATAGDERSELTRTLARLFLQCPMRERDLT